ncbi:hypothetical protein [Sphingomonas baiyangensis]|uniref:Uncharacterized protein n=1 Tax=Sphingomonas baiyangensis TaxID=2572576 RepID=A0A4U1L998_9SPHN|nr:hypothetical protein [Sphingomonas baiyangensis]TKD52886.1 hypothetical protein FBR43_00590 [Sphingomonas baiyangensis]
MMEVKLLDFLGRIALLVLSGSATLALIGAIAQVAETAPGVPPPGERIAIEAAAPDRIEPEPRFPDAPGEDMAPAPPLDAALVSAGQAAADRETARWLEALTYAVMALAGFAAAALLMLLRIAASLARIADR